MCLFYLKSNLLYKSNLRTITSRINKKKIHNRVYNSRELGTLAYSHLFSGPFCLWLGARGERGNNFVI